MRIKFMRSIIVATLCLLAVPAFSAPNVSLLTDTNGGLVWPTNFFEKNIERLNRAITNSVNATNVPVITAGTNASVITNGMERQISADVSKSFVSNVVNAVVAASTNSAVSVAMLNSASNVLDGKIIASTNGLGSAAFSSTSAFDAAGAASTVDTRLTSVSNSLDAKIVAATNGLAGVNGTMVTNAAAYQALLATNALGRTTPANMTNKSNALYGQLYGNDSSGNATLSSSATTLTDTTGNQSINWGNRRLLSTYGTVLDYSGATFSGLLIDAIRTDMTNVVNSNTIPTTLVVQSSNAPTSGYFLVGGNGTNANGLSTGTFTDPSTLTVGSATTATNGPNGVPFSGYTMIPGTNFVYIRKLGSDITATLNDSTKPAATITNALALLAANPYAVTNGYIIIPPGETILCTTDGTLTNQTVTVIAFGATVISTNNHCFNMVTPDTQLNIIGGTWNALGASSGSCFRLGGNLSNSVLSVRFAIGRSEHDWIFRNGSATDGPFSVIVENCDITQGYNADWFYLPTVTSGTNHSIFVNATAFHSYSPLFPIIKAQNNNKWFISNCYLESFTNGSPLVDCAGAQVTIANSTAVNQNECTNYLLRMLTGASVVLRSPFAKASEIYNDGSATVTNAWAATELDLSSGPGSNQVSTIAQNIASNYRPLADMSLGGGTNYGVNTNILISFGGGTAAWNSTYVWSGGAYTNITGSRAITNINNYWCWVSTIGGSIGYSNAVLNTVIPATVAGGLSPGPQSRFYTTNWVPYFTGVLQVGPKGAPITNILSVAAVLDFASTSAQTSSDLTMTVTGAADGDVVSLGVPNAALVSGGMFWGWVSAANTVTVRFLNVTTGALDPASGTFTVTVTKLQ